MEHLKHFPPLSHLEQHIYTSPASLRFKPIMNILNNRVHIAGSVIFYRYF